MEREGEKSRWWWFESHNQTSKHSQWLHSTLAELDAKTKAMLKLIEGNADSFAQRAETYYKKRPELIILVEDFYRAHRSLAERFDHFKSGSRSSQESLCGSNSHTCSEFEDAHSEIEDPDVVEEEEEEDHQTIASSVETKKCKEGDKLEQERLKLIEESDALKKQLLDKDEEKREVIRQLALTVETLKDENLRLKRRLGQESLKKRSVLGGSKPVDKFLGKLFYSICHGK